MDKTNNMTTVRSSNVNAVSPGIPQGGLAFDLHPLYASILSDGARIRRGEVLGLDMDLRRVLVAPFDGTIRLLVTGTGDERRVRVYLTERERGFTFASGTR